MPTLLRTNLVTNPSFETASGTANVRTNLCANPSLESNANDWTHWPGGSGSSSFSRETTGSVINSAFARVTWSVSQTGTNQRGGLYTDAPSIVPGSIYSGSIYARCSKSQIVSMNIEWLNAARDSIVGTSTGVDVTLVANTWTLLKNENLTAPANAAWARATVYSTSTGSLWLAGDTLDGDGYLIETGPVVGIYFDGNTPAAGDFTYAWAGTVNNSASYQQAPGVNNIFSLNCSTIQSSEWVLGGTKSLRCIPNNSSSDSFAEVQNITFSTGKTYTISATCRVAASQTGALDGRARRLAIYHSNGVSQSPQAANSAGSTRLSITFTVTDGAVYTSIRLYNGASEGNGNVWWDDLLIEEVDTLKPYFDGNTTDTAFKLFDWTGAVNASTSTEKSVLNRPASEYSGNDLEFEYYARQSGLAAGSLNDHKYYFFKNQLGGMDGSLNDLELAYFKTISGLPATGFSRADHIHAALETATTGPYNDNKKTYYSKFFS